MTAVLGGLLSAVCFALAALFAQRAGRRLDSTAILAWAMLGSFAVLSIPVALAIAHDAPTEHQALLLTVAGVGNVSGLLAEFQALKRGRVALVVPIISAEGAIGAVVAAISGVPVEAIVWILVGVVVLGVAAVGSGGQESPGDREATDDGVAVGLSLFAAVVFGVALFCQGRAGEETTLLVAVIPPSTAGVVLVSLPLLARRRLPFDRAAVPFALGVGFVEAVGMAGYIIGARDDIAIAAVVSSQFAAVSVLLAAIFLKERPTRQQLIGLVVVAIGVAGLALAQ